MHQVQRLVELIVVEHSKLGQVDQQKGRQEVRKNTNNRIQSHSVTACHNVHLFELCGVTEEQSLRKQSKGGPQ